jgi:hypothetical protein
MMNHWLDEELTWLTYAERQDALEAYRLQNDFSGMQVKLTFTNRAALKLSDWLIASGENLRRRHEKTAPVSPWANKRNYAR